MTQNQISIHVKSVMKPETEPAETIEFEQLERIKRRMTKRISLTMKNMKWVK